MEEECLIFCLKKLSILCFIIILMLNNVSQIGWNLQETMSLFDVFSFENDCTF